MSSSRVLGRRVLGRRRGPVPFEHAAQQPGRHGDEARAHLARGRRLQFPNRASRRRGRLQGRASFRTTLGRPPPPPRALAGHPVVRHLEPDAKPRRRQRRRGRRGCGTSRPNLGRWAAGGPSTTALALAVASLSSRSGPASRHYRPSGRRRVIGCECPQVVSATRARGPPGAR